jgi:hypothetical protein
LLEVTIYASDGFLDHYEWKGEPDYREFCVPPADLKTRIISIHLMSPKEQNAACLMQREVVPPNYDLIRIRKARLEKMIDGLYRVIDFEAIFSNSKELGSLGCAGQ